MFSSVQQHVPIFDLQAILHLRAEIITVSTLLPLCGTIGEDNALKPDLLVE